jgi:uncharacterized protein YycO
LEPAGFQAVVQAVRTVVQRLCSIVHRHLNILRNE